MVFAGRIETNAVQEESYNKSYSTARWSRYGGGGEKASKDSLSSTAYSTTELLLLLTSFSQMSFSLPSPRGDTGACQSRRFDIV